MNISRRLVFSVFILLIILFVGLLNWAFVVKEILMPVSLVAWLFLRILVLSIHQQYFWVALILSVFIFLYRLFPPEQTTISLEEGNIGNETISTIGVWYRLILSNDGNIRDKTALKRDFTRMVVSLYATKLHTQADFHLFDALRRGEIPLPEPIYIYLFQENQQKKERSIKEWIRSLLNNLRLWIHHLTGQEKADHYRMIEEVLCFLETSLEMKNDDGKFKSNQY